MPQKSSSMQVFINNNASFCYQSKEKVLSLKFFRRMQIWTKKDKNRGPYWWWFRKSESGESGSESDSDSNDETESDDESNN